MNAYRLTQAVLRETSPLRQVWPEGLVQVRVYHGRKLFDAETGKMVENGVLYSLELTGLHGSLLEQLAVVMSSRWGWRYDQGLLLLQVDGELPIGDEHFAGTVFNGSEL